MLSREGKQTDRGIATRFDRNITNFIAAIALAAAVIWWL